MKKSFGILITCTLALSLLLVTFGNVSAKKLDTSVPDPVVTSGANASEFATEIVPTESLPGVTTLDNGMLVPAGFPAGEKQFEGNALQLTGLEKGIVKACFAFSGVTSGWGGHVGMWDGSKWELLPTTVNTPTESRVSWACADVTSSGIYAFIKWVTDASLLYPKASCGVIDPIQSGFSSYSPAGGSQFSVGNLQLVSDYQIPIGTKVAFSVNGSPVTGTVSDSYLLGPGVWYAEVDFVPGILLPMAQTSYKITVGSCSFTTIFPAAY